MSVYVALLVKVAGSLACSDDMLPPQGRPQNAAFLHALGTFGWHLQC